MSSVKLFVAAALVAPAPFVSLSMPANAAATVATCQPLSASNLEECCAAENWRDIIREGDFRFCPPLANDDQSGRVGDALVGGGGNEIPGPGGGPDTTGSIGNPGNTKPVGAAGEQDKGPVDDPTGTKGTSN
jgi:hypothetical protein